MVIPRPGHNTIDRYNYNAHTHFLGTQGAQATIYPAQSPCTHATAYLLSKYDPVAVRQSSLPLSSGFALPPQLLFAAAVVRPWLAREEKHHRSDLVSVLMKPD